MSIRFALAALAAATLMGCFTPAPAPDWRASLTPERIAMIESRVGQRYFPKMDMEASDLRPPGRRQSYLYEIRANGGLHRYPLDDLYGYEMERIELIHRQPYYVVRTFAVRSTHEYATSPTFWEIDAFLGKRMYIPVQAFNDEDFQAEHPTVTKAKQEWLERQAAKLRIEAKLAEMRRQVEANLKSVGVVPGTHLWLRQPQRGMPALTRGKFLRHELRGTIILEISGREVELSILWLDLPGKHFKESFAEHFSLSEPREAKAWPREVVEAIRARSPRRGMTRAQVIMALGRPADINESVGVWGTDEQWVYDSPAMYVYLRNGIVTAYQR